MASLTDLRKTPKGYTGNKPHQVRYRDHTGRQRSEQFTARADAASRLREVQTMEETGRLDLLDAGPHPALRERYAQRLATATGLTWPAAPWLVAADPLLTAADYLRALALARAYEGSGNAPALSRTLTGQTARG